MKDRGRDADRELADAVAWGDIRTVRAALARGADPNQRLAGGETLLMRAMAPDAGTAIVRMLLARGARVDAVDDTGRTALHHAAAAGRLDVARLLLDRGADVDARTARGERALDFVLRISHDLALADLARARSASGGAAQRDDPKRVEAERAARRRDAGATLAVAAIRGDRARVLKLIAEGVDAPALTAALANAAQTGDVVLGRALIDAGADPGGRVAASTVLHRAAWFGQAAFVSFLVDEGVAIAARDSAGKTALHAAVVTSHAKPAAIVATVRVLLVAGAETHTVDADGYSPRTSARALGHEPLVDLLPPGPGEPPIDATAAGIDAIRIGWKGDVEIFFHPNDVLWHIELIGGYRRDPWGFRTDPATALTRHRDDLVNGGAGWFLPTIEAMRGGRRPAYAEVEAAFRRHHDLEPEVRRFPPWSVQVLEPKREA